ncbi:acetoacetyl-CoA thiolase 2 [Perilla frutescens var. hirtella]|nr:acetoacetyl-CoA thiolase 2 [Perilla frutescens var. hirtella]
MLAAQSIELGINDVVVAGGMESMSNVPKDDLVVDGMVKDGLWDVYNEYEMGVCAELCAQHYNVTTEELDDYAVQSYERGIAGHDNGAFAWEIVPFDAAKLRKLRPCFKQTGGTVTAGNASAISDGAAAIVPAIPKAIRNAGLQASEINEAFANQKL